jgi:pyruvate formate lyase activating enzyme
VIPGFNDSVEAITAIVEFIKQKPNVSYELLPYHRLGQSKYEYLGTKYPLGDVSLSDEKMQILTELVKKNF